MDKPANRSVMYALVVVFLTVLAVMVLSIWYSNRVQQESNRNWCSLVTNLDDAYKQNPPSSPVGKKIAQDMHNLRQRLGCS